jgi:chromosome segregation ATPase
MLKNNQFSSGSPILTSAKSIITSDKNIEADKYISDFKLLDIRCSVLEEEKQEYL